MEKDLNAPELYKAIKLYQNGKSCEARECLEIYLKNDPNNHAAWIILGVICFDLGDKGASSQAYENAFKIPLKSPSTRQTESPWSRIRFILALIILLILNIIFFGLTIFK